MPDGALAKAAGVVRQWLDETVCAKCLSELSCTWCHVADIKTNASGLARAVLEAVKADKALQACRALVGFLDWCTALSRGDTETADKIYPRAEVTESNFHPLLVRADKLAREALGIAKTESQETSASCPCLNCVHRVVERGEMRERHCAAGSPWFEGCTEESETVCQSHRACGRHGDCPDREALEMEEGERK